MSASVLTRPQQPELRFGSAEEANQAVQQLVAILPESQPVWLVMREVSQDLGVNWNISQN